MTTSLGCKAFMRDARTTPLFCPFCGDTRKKHYQRKAEEEAFVAALKQSLKDLENDDSD